MSVQFDRLIPALVQGRIEFIIVGGFCAALHGSSRNTLDLDIVYARSPENLKRIVDTLRPLHPYLRGAPPGLPFRFDELTLRNGLNFTLITDLGSLDLLGDITGGGKYQDLLSHTQELEMFGVSCRILNLDTLIVVKNAAGRARDLEAVAELKAILEESEPT